MGTPLPQKFFNHPALRVAPSLLGKFLVRKKGRREIVAMITEVEAYDGPMDKASHAHRGQTQRNAPMFGEAGHWYVYLCYGVHEMLNIVTGPAGYPAAILIRAVTLSPSSKHSHILQNVRMLIEGPGRVTRRMKVGRQYNDKPASPKSGLWIEDRGVKIPKRSIKKSPRIGVPYAGAWAKKDYRFFLEQLR